MTRPRTLLFTSLFLIGYVAVSQGVHLRSYSRTGDQECGDVTISTAELQNGFVCCEVYEEFYKLRKDQCPPENVVEADNEAVAPMYVSPADTPGLEHINWDAIQIIPIKSAKAFAAIYRTPRGRGSFFLKATCSGDVPQSQVPNAQQLIDCGDNAAAVAQEFHFMSKFCTTDDCSGDRQSFTRVYGQPTAPSGPFQGKHILVSQLVPSDFSTEVKKARSWSEKMELATKLLRGVEMMHSQNVAHLDFKPDNLRWDPDSEYKIKIFDWDISADGSETYPYPTSLSALRTTEQVYPPEGDDKDTARNFDYWKRFDMFGVGCALMDIFIADKGVSAAGWVDSGYDSNMKVWALGASGEYDATDERSTKNMVSQLMRHAEIDNGSKDALITALAGLVGSDTSARPTATDLLQGFFKSTHDSLTSRENAAVTAEREYESRRQDENDEDGRRYTDDCADCRNVGFDIGQDPFAYIQKRAPTGAPNTQREYEFPYELPTNRLTIGRGNAAFTGAAGFGNAKEATAKRIKELFDGTLNDETYLWVLTDGGDFLIAPEVSAQYTTRKGEALQDIDGFMIPLSRARNMKHGDLLPVNDGHHRGEARMGGQFKVEVNSLGTRAWIMDNDSSYCYNRADGKVLHWRSLYAAAKLLKEYGVDISGLNLKDTSHIEGSKQVSLPIGEVKTIRVIGERGPKSVTMDAETTVGDALREMRERHDLVADSSMRGVSIGDAELFHQGRRVSDMGKKLSDFTDPVHVARPRKFHGGM